MTTYSDDFNRASLGTNWDNVRNVWEIISNAAEPQTNSDNTATRVATGTATFNADQEASAIIANLDADNYTGPAVRVNTSGQGYAVLVNGTGANNAQMYEVNNSSDNAIGSAFSVSNSDRVYIRAIGTTISAGVGGVEQASTTDATYSSGQPGMIAYNADSGNETTLDDFEATDEFGGGASPRNILLLGVG